MLKTLSLAVALALLGWFVFLAMFSFFAAAGPSPSLTLTTPYDRDENGQVNVGDVIQAFLQGQYGTVAGDALYDRESDIDNDGDIDVGDVVRFRTVILQLCSPICGDVLDIELVNNPNDISAFEAHVCYPVGTSITDRAVDFLLAENTGSNVIDFSPPTPDSDGAYVVGAADFAAIGSGAAETGDGILARLTTDGEALDIGVGEVTIVEDDVTVQYVLDLGGC